MQEPERSSPPERSDDQSPRPVGSTASRRLEGAYPTGDPPTVLSGPGSTASLSAAAGSSVRRVQIVSDAGPGSLAFTTPLPLPQAGDRIDMFALEEPIGVGGMGAVFRALDTRLDRQVALKILPPEQAHDPEVVQRFYQEGRAAARLDHENIARVFTIGHDGRYHHIAFEYIEGTTIRQRVEKNGPLPVSEAINYTLQIADALVHAAEREVVHRDIKPSNIIVTPHGRAKLVDMGLARRFERGGDDGLTQSGMTLGTFDYISPEQARDPRDVDVRSDLYSLGCTLFHMLTGRPPFPEGTVLQKLLQHQEEAPPDVRTLNPAVPTDLASILVKLMAKDRDRRYQTPEQLVRDLLTVAGALGLRSVSPEGLVWLASDPPPTWVRHLVWGIPALAFALIMGALFWWSQDAGRTGTTPPLGAIAKLNDPPPPAVSLRSSPPGPAPSAARNGPDGPGDPLEEEGPSPVPRDVTVEPDEDLTAAILKAPPRSVIELSGDGPYDLSAGRLPGRDVTLKAAAGAHPILRFARDLPAGARPRPALLDFAGGHVTLEGLEFELDPGDRREPIAAVRSEDTELTVRRCLFRGTGEPPGSGADGAALLVRATAAVDGRPPAVRVERSHFDGGQVAIRAVGPVDISVRESTIAGADPAFWVDNGRASSPVPAELRLRHVSVVAGKGPVFRFEGTDPRVWVDDSVVAPAGDGEATLVATDQPDALVWRGRGNLYGRVGTFLRPTGGRTGREPIRDPERWKETPDQVRESGTEVVTHKVWAEADPSRALARDSENPGRAFRLAAGLPGKPGAGTRQASAGKPIPTGSPAATTTKPVGGTGTGDESPAGRTSAAPTVPTGEPAASARVAVTTDHPDVATAGITPEADPAAAASPTRMEGMPVTPPGPATAEDTIPEMPVAASDPEPTHTVSAEKPTTGAGLSSASTAKPPAQPTTPAPSSSRPEQTVLHTADQWLNALGKPGSPGGHLHVAANVDWEVPAATVRATGAWRVEAEPGRTRPRIRFLPDPAGTKAPTAWTALVNLRSGSLQLEGFDVVLPRANAPRQGRWAAFAVWPATDLKLINCTVTVEGEEVVSAVVAVEAGDDEMKDVRDGAEPAAATVRVNDSLLRTGGDLVDVNAGRRLVFEMDNAVIATGGALVHAHGIPRGQVAERLNLTLRKVTARTAGGLVQLESTPADPELPVADVTARDSILSTTPKDAPLIRVDGQDAPASMRDRVVWEGLGVGYHQITTYRRDQSSQFGAAPTLYDRPSWTVAVGERETSPVHGDLKFRQSWPTVRPLWTLQGEDVRLGADSPARTSGSDLDRIPDPPPASH